MNQTYADIEYIIIDGGSTDGTIDLIKKYEPAFCGRMKWISEKDNGIYDAINRGIRMAKGEILAWLNSDNMYMPWAIQVVAKAMSKYNVDWCTGIPGIWSENNIYNYFNEIEDICKLSSYALKFLNKHLYLSFLISYIN